MKRATLIPLTIIAALAVPGVAEAHNATASGTCQQGVTWEVWNYDKTVVNTITVTIDGTVRWQDTDFKSSDAGTIATDRTLPHSWSVVVDAPGTQYDRHLSGSYGACETAPTTTVPESTLPATTEPSTTLPATTTVVAVDIPPVPTVAPSTTVLTDVATLTPEPVLPATGVSLWVFWVACFLVGAGIGATMVRRR